MIRTQIQLDEGQYKMLKALACKRSTSVSELVREGIGGLLKADENAPNWGRLWQAVGACHDKTGADDVATDHDFYLNRISRNG